MIFSLARITENRFLQAVRNGMVMAIPAIMVGVFSILLSNLPVPVYQSFIKHAGNGVIQNLFTLLTDCTIGIFVLILLFTISYSYEKLLDVHNPGILTVLCVSAYTAFATDYSKGLDIAVFDKTNLLLAIIILFIVTRLYTFLTSRRIFHVVTYTEGADSSFNAAMSSILPVAIITLFFALLKIMIWKLTGISDFQAFQTAFLSGLFIGGGRNLASMLQFVFLVHLFWFFGIHGSNVLESVAQSLFMPGLAMNTASLQAGLPPTEIISKTFIDSFVLMGGCGSAMCLVIALIIFEKRRNVRSLTGAAFSQVLFNINELIVFGLPIVFNLLLFIPFIITPLIMALTSYTAVKLGLVPLTACHVDWTTPVILSGYVATGSIAGSLLQIFNLALGTAIYAPFVLLSQKHYSQNIKRNIDSLTGFIKSSESEGRQPEVKHLSGDTGAVCRMLTSELKNDLKAGRIEVYYQPQMHYEGRITGFEALLRWRNREAGFLYPPLVIAIAEEAGILDQLADFVTDKACSDMEKLSKLTDRELCVAVNFSARQINNPHLAERVISIMKRYHTGNLRLGVEITEQAALSLSGMVTAQLAALRQSGISVIMDDFGMGHSSMVHLQNNQFDEIKLDGSMVRQLLDNPRSSDIISSIVYLSQSLGFHVLAEFVDTGEQMERLHALGCDIYQGWLFSPALPFQEAVDYMVRTCDGEKTGKDQKKCLKAEE